MSTANSNNLAVRVLAPFLLVNRIGVGLALAATAALIYVPFSQRSLLLMDRGKPDWAWHGVPDLFFGTFLFV